MASVVQPGSERKKARGKRVSGDERWKQQLLRGGGSRQPSVVVYSQQRNRQRERERKRRQRKTKVPCAGRMQFNPLLTFPLFMQIIASMVAHLLRKAQTERERGKGIRDTGPLLPDSILFGHQHGRGRQDVTFYCCWWTTSFAPLFFVHPIVLCVF